MNDQCKLKFYKDQHKSLTDDMNHVSDDLLKAKWFFLASIAALGAGYAKIYDLSYGFSYTHKAWGIWFICLVGNVAFWLLSEYALSHAFLFRYLQTRMARIEKIFEAVPPIKDPTKIDNFIDMQKMQLKIDLLIPDQFVPIYWASIYLILINAAGGFFLTLSYFDNFSPKLLWPYMAISFPFIWKLWTYYLYKINGLIENNCSFRLILKNHTKNKGYFDSSIFGWRLFFIPLAFGILFAFVSNQYHWIGVFLVGGLFLYVVFGIVIHIFKVIIRLPFPQHSCFFPEVKKSRECEREYEVLQCPCLRVFTYLFIVA